MSSTRPRRHRPARPTLTGAAALLALALALPGTAFALSEIPQEEVPEQPPITSVPLPPPIANPGNATPDGDGATAPAEGEQPAEEEDAAPAEIPEIIYDLSRLPEPARALHDKLVEICKSGDIEALRPLITPGEDGTMLTFGGGGEDPIEFLKSLSGDGQGHEILAILEEVLEAGFVHLEAGTEGEMYVWPYFFAVPLDSLNGPQLVELFRLVTAGDYQDMKSYGAYIFYRTGITPAGKWAFFVAGD
jgi:hypothetical protein